MGTRDRTNGDVAVIATAVASGDVENVAGDGMAIDVADNVHVCCPGDGSLPTNCCFGRADGTDLFVTLAMAQTVARLSGRPHPGVDVITWPGLVR